MNLHISHITEYFFSTDVFFEPHVLRFKPKATPYCCAREHHITVDPEPAGLSRFLDSENNDIQLCWFNDVHSKLYIKSESLLTISPYNPFQFLIYPLEYNVLPFQYTPTDSESLEIYLRYQDVPDDLANFGKQILKASNNETIPFLTNITKAIHDDFLIETRLEGAPYTPAKSFNLKRGSCRDLAWMQINLLRFLGIASRFVSGYYFLDDGAVAFELHAWLEVYLPGAGWIGLDPTHGIVTGNHHIPVASSRIQENTMPVSGTIRGSATSKMETNLYIQKLK
ncbi:transglutaminase domain-containing protein [Saccharicrinis sp. FJH2]|uniref:transglutaminase family protein n=1 Tax=Saccharicrinis sp. FJH65 TaxID=3344659 RepID=UPI0035F3D73E